MEKTSSYTWWKTRFDFFT